MSRQIDLSHRRCSSESGIVGGKRSAVVKSLFMSAHFPFSSDGIIVVTLSGNADSLTILKSESGLSVPFCASRIAIDTVL